MENRVGEDNNPQNQLSKKLEFEIILMFRMAMPAEIASYALGSLKYDFIRSPASAPKENKKPTKIT